MSFRFSAPYSYFLADIEFCFHLSPIFWLLPSKIGTVEKTEDNLKKLGDNSEPAPSRKKRYCVKFNDSNFKFIQKSWTGLGFSLSTVCGSDFSVARGGENNINRYKTKTPQNIDIWMLINRYLDAAIDILMTKKINWFWSKFSDSKPRPKSSESCTAFFWFSDWTQLPFEYCRSRS